MAALATIKEISPTELGRLDVKPIIIDVRRPDEFSSDLGHIRGAVLATLETDLEAYLGKLSRSEPYVFVCKAGGRSAAAAKMAIQAGFTDVTNMVGGMMAWNQAGLPIER